MLPVNPIQIAVSARWRALFHSVEFVFLFGFFWQLPGVELGSSLGAAEQQLPIEKKWNDRKWPFTSLTFLTSIALPVARPGSLAGTLQAQRSGLMETNCMIVEKAGTIHSRGSVANPSLRQCKKEFSMGSKFRKPLWPRWLLHQSIHSTSPAEPNFTFSCRDQTALGPGLPYVYEERWNSNGSKSLFSTKALEIVLRGYQSKHIQKLPLYALSARHRNAFLTQFWVCFFFFVLVLTFQNKYGYEF